MVANPYEDREPECEEVSWAAAFPGVAAGLSLCWCAVFQAAKESTVPSALCASCLVLFFLFVCSICLMILNGNCHDEDQAFVLSMSLMFFIPIALVLCCMISSGILSCLDKCLADNSAGTDERPAGRDERQQTTGPTGPTSRGRTSRPRVRRAQRMLREALILGDSSIADLLLDFRERRFHALWRMYRCVFMTFMHCQLRCSCCAGVSEEDKSPTSPGSLSPASRASVSRASLFFAYEDEDAGELPIHYLARGEMYGEAPQRGAAAAARRCLTWGGQKRTLPQLTDERRARLLRDLVASGRLPFGQLYVINAFAQTPLHCAASSGSSAVVLEIQALLRNQSVALGAGESVEAVGEMMWAQDAHGDSPCDVALKNGHVSCASHMSGEWGVWQGLSKLPAQRQALRDCLAGALGQMSPAPPAEEGNQRGPKPMIHEDAGQLLSLLDRQIRELQTSCGLVLARNAAQLLPRNAAEALLRYHDFDVQTAAAAFRSSPRDAWRSKRR